MTDFYLKYFVHLCVLSFYIYKPYTFIHEIILSYFIDYIVLQIIQGNDVSRTFLRPLFDIHYQSVDTFLF